MSNKNKPLKIYLYLVQHNKMHRLQIKVFLETLSSQPITQNNRTKKHQIKNQQKHNQISPLIKAKMIQARNLHYSTTILKQTVFSTT